MDDNKLETVGVVSAAAANAMAFVNWLATETSVTLQNVNEPFLVQFYRTAADN